MLIRLQYSDGRGVFTALTCSESPPRFQLVFHAARVRFEVLLPFLHWSPSPAHDFWADQPILSNFILGKKIKIFFHPKHHKKFFSPFLSFFLFFFFFFLAFHTILSTQFFLPPPNWLVTLFRLVHLLPTGSIPCKLWVKHGTTHCHTAF